MMENRKLMSESKIISAFHRFPVTIALLIPYLVLILPTALLNQNPSIAFIIGVLGLAVLGAMSIELFALFVPKVRYPRATILREMSGRRYFWLGSFAVTFSSLLGIVGAFEGGGTIFTQVHGGGGSVWSSVASLTGTWQFSGLGLCLAAFLRNACSRKEVLTIAGLELFLVSIETYLTAITSPLISLIIFISIALFFFRVVSVRWLAVTAMALLAIWPSIYSIRNEIREQGGVIVSQTVDAVDRLRVDLQITSAVDLPVPIDVGQPGFLEVLRFGLIPRLIDPSRPTLSTGRDINVYLGGSEYSAFTFLPVTTVYVLEGALGVILFYALTALIIFFLVRGNIIAMSPVKIALFCLVLSGPLGWFATHPDTAIGVLQGSVALLALLLVGRLWPRKGNPGLRSSHSVD